LGDLVRAVSFARAFRNTRDHPGAGEAGGRVFVRNGSFFAGAVVFITAEFLKLTFVERLFQLNREKLLSIPAFAWGMGTGGA
jgi:hypothetical protein